MENRQRRGMGERDGWGREAGFSAAAAKYAASGRNDEFWVEAEENRQRQMQRRNAGVLRFAQNDKSSSAQNDKSSFAQNDKSGFAQDDKSICCVEQGYCGVEL
jgi:hypothetical protein